MKRFMNYCGYRVVTEVHKNQTRGGVNQPANPGAVYLVFLSDFGVALKPHHTDLVSVFVSVQKINDPSYQVVSSASPICSHNSTSSQEGCLIS